VRYSVCGLGDTLGGGGGGPADPAITRRRAGRHGVTVGDRRQGNQRARAAAAGHSSHFAPIAPRPAQEQDHRLGEICPGRQTVGLVSAPLFQGRIQELRKGEGRSTSL